ncbi:glycoside hydrolase family 36 protein [Streptomyces sp. NPDC047880]|uniref:glycoside hydrolase family 36 protein n=1 Tax=Streptomyces sp. NPDC047880 TaxID=3155626 RepID=UPI0034535A6C
MSTPSPEAVTTAELAPATYELLLDQVRIAVLAPRADPHWSLTEGFDGLSVLHVEASGNPVEIRLHVPLGDAAGYWHPQARWQRTLLADWEGRARVSLVDGLAAGCLYDHTGATMLAFSVADPVPEVQLRFGVSEENDTFVVHMELPALPGPHRILFVPRSESVATAMRALRGWYAATTSAMPVPEAARLPVYSTWYAFNQQVDAEAVETQARLAARLGCGVLILDDGWQRLGSGRGYAGCGDWLPDTDKFPDFAGHVARVKALGLRYMAWVAPLLVGPAADCYPQWAASAPAPARAPGAYVLDPRRPEVRRHVVEMCTALVRDHGLDGLKVDFVDEAMVYAGDGGDIGHALTELLTDLRTALQKVRPELLLELRQPYVGPGMAAYGNMLRSFDCPADATANRVRTIDTSLLAVGGTVHSDMLLWDPSGPLEAAVRQFIGAFHSVPQLSVRLDTLPPEQLEALGFWLGQWRRLRPQLLDGRVEPGRPDDLYPVVESRANGVCVVSVHSERAVSLRLTAFDETVLVNGSDVDRLVVDVRDPGAAVDIDVHSSSGRIIEQGRIDLPPGLHSLPVPRMGLAVVRRSS